MHNSAFETGFPPASTIRNDTVKVSPATEVWLVGEADRTDGAPVSAVAVNVTNVDVPDRYTAREFVPRAVPRVQEPAGMVATPLTALTEPEPEPPPSVTAYVTVPFVRITSPAGSNRVTLKAPTEGGNRDRLVIA